MLCMLSRVRALFVGLPDMPVLHLRSKWEEDHKGLHSAIIARILQKDFNGWLQEDCNGRGFVDGLRDSEKDLSEGSEPWYQKHMYGVSNSWMLCLNRALMLLS